MSRRETRQRQDERERELREKRRRRALQSRQRMVQRGQTPTGGWKPALARYERDDGGVS